MSGEQEPQGGPGPVRRVRRVAQGCQGGLPHRHHHPQEPRRPLQETGQVRGRRDPGGLRAQDQVRPEVALYCHIL